MTMNQNKTVYVLWSGGLDSTYLIYKLLKDDPTVKVVAGYIEIKNNQDKSIMEKDRCQKLAEIFFKEYKYRFDYRGVVTTVDILSVHAQKLKFNQVPIWIFGAIMSIPRDIDEVAISYVMNDDAISYLADIKNVWDTYAEFVYGKMPTLTFPLMKTKKEEIIDELPSEIKELVWWCETPKMKIVVDSEKLPTSFEPCGHCNSCDHSPIMKSVKRGIEYGVVGCKDQVSAAVCDIGLKQISKPVETTQEK